MIRVMSSRWIRYPLGLLFFLSALLLARAVGYSLLTLKGYAGFVISVSIVLYVIIIIHELGHLLSALVNDCAIRFVIIGNLFYVVRRPTGFRWGLGRRREFPRGGAVGITARSLDRLVTRHRAIYLAGPAANIIQAGVSIAVFFALPDHLIYARFVTALMAGLSFVTGVTNLLLTRSELGMTADGGMIRLLGRRDEHGQRMVSLITLDTLAFHGQRPRDWNPELIMLATAIGDGTQQDVTGHFYGMMRAMDVEDSELAEKHANYVVERFDVVPNLYIEPMCMELAYYFGIFERDVDEAWAWLNRGMPSLLTEEINRLRAEAACALAAGHSDDAERLARTALDTLASYGSAVTDYTSYAWLNTIISQAQDVRTSNAESAA